MTNPVVGFEIMGQDADKLRTFHGELLGWRFDTDDPMGDDPMGDGTVEPGDGGVAGGVGLCADRAPARLIEPRQPRGPGLGSGPGPTPGPRGEGASEGAVRRTDRLFQLVQLLRTRRGATGAELAAELGVSTRTLYRDVHDLQRSGIPIRGEAGVGYRLDRGFELPPLTFRSDELEGLVLGARIVAAWGDPELAAAVASAMRRIEAAVPEGLRAVLGETALFAPAFHRNARMASHLPLMRRAISERRALHFAYTRADGDASTRTVRPLGLYFWGSKWTLAAWCELRRDYRSFRPDRMAEVRLLDRVFETDGGISLGDFLQRMDAEEPFPSSEPEGTG